MRKNFQKMTFAISIVASSIFSQVMPSAEYCSKYPDDSGCANTHDANMHKSNKTNLDKRIIDTASDSENSAVVEESDRIKNATYFSDLIKAFIYQNRCFNSDNIAKRKQCEENVVKDILKMLSDNKYLVLERGFGKFSSDYYLNTEESVVEGEISTAKGIKLLKLHPNVIEVDMNGKTFMWLGKIPMGLAAFFMKEEILKICNQKCLKEKSVDGYMIYFGKDIENTLNSETRGIMVALELTAKEAAEWDKGADNIVVEAFSVGVSHGYITIWSKLK